MVTEAPPRPVAEPRETTVLFPEARRLERRRWLFWGGLALTLGTVAAGAGLIATSPSSPPSPGLTIHQLLARPLHLPSLNAGGRCPVSVGETKGTKYFGGDVFGHGPVRVAIGDGGDAARGRVDLGSNGFSGWYALETIWYALPSYKGPFVVRAAKIGVQGADDVRPNGHGTSPPGAGSLVVPAGPTMNTYAGYRTQPGSTWVTKPGCYAWQVDGTSFSDVIVVDLVIASHAAKG